ncbi:hypothetical protein SAMD00019534_094400 [Acytostelium subglobosum LB1]|uniref:hypothetical protein n=1 Tax=Acytostelium subglobosum LB1 TaxID=1410327 RepID=UPI0006451B5D|nr:hypothetical protein SAMD00019534_094400 [Acytostelium subglobosum LB1]GAM26265.1 hypothetical protein SAMD00019534_094400 [Acytostelium subglobosum LB1]|eukprot:XP_012750819.1 hypothetical protein SAMD00019534_094400 [Acytostelium subglobosum LB1]
MSTTDTTTTASDTAITPSTSSTDVIADQHVGDATTTSTTTTETSTTEPSTELSTTTTTEDKPMSKGQLKRQLKAERWNQMKDQRKEYFREKKREKLKRKKQEMTPEQRKEKEIRKRKKRRDPSTIDYSGNVILDMEMSHLMGSKEEKSLINQVCYLYGANNKADRPLKVDITGYTGKVRDTMESMSGVANWKLTKHTETYMELFDKQELVYLTSDSPNSIQTLDPTKRYIIGSFVDHNRYKGYTYKKATDQGIATARLPISEYITLSSRKVLTVNHAYTQNGDWKQSFEQIIPARKISDDPDNEGEDEDYNEEDEGENNNEDKNVDQSTISATSTTNDTTANDTATTTTTTTSTTSTTPPSTTKSETPTTTAKLGTNPETFIQPDRNQI